MYSFTSIILRFFSLVQLWFLLIIIEYRPVKIHETLFLRQLLYIKFFNVNNKI